MNNNNIPRYIFNNSLYLQLLAPRKNQLKNHFKCMNMYYYNICMYLLSVIVKINLIVLSTISSESTSHIPRPVNHGESVCVQRHDRVLK